MRSVKAGVLALALALCLFSPGAAQGRTIVSLEFDDATSDQVAIPPILAAHGMRATFFVNSARIGSPGYMSVPQVLGLQAQGHEVAGHTLSHAYLPALGGDDQGMEICGDRKRLAGLGLNITDFAYPFGAYTRFTQWVVGFCGYTNARTAWGLACRRCPAQETLPPRNPDAIRTAPLVNDDTTVAAMKRWVLAAERDPGRGWLPIVFHQVCEFCTDAAIPPAEFSAFLDWLEVRPQTPVMTMREVLALPAVRRPVRARR